MRLPLVLAAMCTALPLAGCGSAHDGPAVAKAWVRLAAVPGRPAAAYFTVGSRNEDRREALVRVESALASRIELHESMAGTAGMMEMRPLARVPLPPYRSIAFAPGGRHAMIYGLGPAVVPGTKIPLRFTFASGATVTAEAAAVAAGGDAPY